MASALLVGSRVSAEIQTPAQVEADIEMEALEWFQPDMSPQELAEVEFQSRCVLGMPSPKCKNPIHPIPPEVAIRVLHLLLEAKEIHYQHGPKAFESWLTTKNVYAEQALQRAYARRPVTTR